ncbi:hypothetical protein F5884DRAFT_805808 [Xylogone sp. PMI_703]|nr:hypothetical protein F5884DRAFT_805808 [Xylogone sp. PMI_703]
MSIFITDPDQDIRSPQNATQYSKSIFNISARKDLDMTPLTSLIALAVTAAAIPSGVGDTSTAYGSNHGTPFGIPETEFNAVFEAPNATLSSQNFDLGGSGTWSVRVDLAADVSLANADRDQGSFQDDSVSQITRLSLIPDGSINSDAGDITITTWHALRNNVTQAVARDDNLLACGYLDLAPGCKSAIQKAADPSKDNLDSPECRSIFPDNVTILQFTMSPKELQSSGGFEVYGLGITSRGSDDARESYDTAVFDSWTVGVHVDSSTYVTCLRPQHISNGSRDPNGTSNGSDGGDSTDSPSNSDGSNSPDAAGTSRANTAYLTITLLGVTTLLW